jgi:hypothetical protein
MPSLFVTRSPNGPLRSVGFNSEITKVLGKVSSPFTKRMGPDIKPGALLALHLDHHMHVRMALVQMECHHVSVLQGEFLSGKDLGGTQNLVG